MNKDNVIVIFKIIKKNIVVDLEIPLWITANDLISALNDAYNLGIDISDIKNCFLIAENPIALLKGNKTLKEYGIRNGSFIIYKD